MNSQHVSGIIQLNEFLPNEILRMINEYLYNPYEDIMNKVINDIRNKNFELKTTHIRYSFNRFDINIRYNYLVNQLNCLKTTRQWTYAYKQGRIYLYLPNKDELDVLLYFNNINSKTVKGYKKLNKTQLIQLLIKL